MQLKGLVRFFTVLLIIYSLYQLSFTWFVQNHEKKQEATAQAWLSKNFESAEKKFPGDKAAQQTYQEEVDRNYRRYLDSLLKGSENTTITYGINGAVTYKTAKEEELNLGLDLQGGMNVTMEVEMSGLLKSLANNSSDPNFLNALNNADKRKANSDADFIGLFLEEYKKLEPNRALAGLFAAASSNEINIKSTDEQVASYIRKQAGTAFNLTFDRLRTRIDQFGVAQPSINPIPSRGLISVELPGIKDKERVRKLLQSTANLQFWEVYTLADVSYQNGWQKTITAFNTKYGGVADTTKKDTVPATATIPAVKTDTNQTVKLASDSPAAATTAQPTANSADKMTIDKFLMLMQQQCQNEYHQIHRQ